MKKYLPLLVLFQSMVFNAQESIKNDSSNANKTKKIEEVKLSKKTDLVENRLDKTVVNISQSISSTGTNVWELLNKLPGVSVDNGNNTVSLIGKSGILVYVDGQPTYLAGEQLADYLKSIASDDIDKIEVITSPSSKYDAAGDAGILNILTKKNLKKGWNLNTSNTYSLAKNYQFITGVNGNYRNNKINISAGYRYSHGKRWYRTEITRHFADQSYTEQTSDGTNWWDNHTIRLGVDYFIDKKNTLGINVNYNTNPNRDQALYRMNTYSLQGLSSIILNNNDYKQKRNYISYKGYYEHIFDNKDKKLSINLLYHTYNTKNNESFENILYNPDGSLNNIFAENPSYRKGNNGSDINIQALNIDYVHPLGENFKLEAGYKTSIVKSNNDISYQLLRNNIWDLDTTTNNHFKYTESINAAYINTKKEFGSGWSAQAGLRAEFTHSKGYQIINDSLVKRSYRQLFPSLFVQKKIEDNTFGARYTKRVDRPNYTNLNPFIYYLDSSTFVVGNPFLRPQISNNYELNYSYKNLIVASVRHSYTDDVIMDIVRQDDIKKLSYQTKENMSSLGVWSINTSVNWPNNSFIKANTNISLMRSSSTGIYLETPFIIAKSSVRISNSTSFSLLKDIKMEISTIYNTSALYGIFMIKNQFQMDLGIQREIFNKKGNLKLAVNDIFHSMYNRAEIRFGNINSNVKNVWENRRISLSFTYNLIRGKNSSPKPTTQQEEETRI